MRVSTPFRSHVLPTSSRCVLVVALLRVTQVTTESARQLSVAHAHAGAIDLMTGRPAEAAGRFGLQLEEARKARHKQTPFAFLVVRVYQAGQKKRYASYILYGDYHTVLLILLLLLFCGRVQTEKTQKTVNLALIRTNGEFEREITTLSAARVTVCTTAVCPEK